MSSLISTKPILVTGAGGWLASHVVYQLLEKGYKVRGTVRDLNGSKYAFLKSTSFHPRVNELLELVEADLLCPDNWENIVDGVEYVIHLASPFTFKYKDQQKELLDPAIKGVESVLNACCKEGSSVKRVIQTSSVCSVVFGHPKERYSCNLNVVDMAKGLFNEECEKNRIVLGCKENLETSNTGNDDSPAVAKKVDEETCVDPYQNLRTRKPVPEEWASWKLMNPSDWSVPETIRGYELSKVLAEKKAWEIVNKHNAEHPDRKLELVALCPGFIFGPIFCEAHASGASSVHVLRLLNRTYPFVPAINSAHVDVRDAAKCHILAMENPKVANKRYMVTADDGNINFAEQAMLLNRSMKKYGFCCPTAEAPKFLTQMGAFFSTSIATAADKLYSVTYATNKATHEELGMTEWRTTEGALFAHAISLVKFNQVSAKKVPEELLKNFKAY